MNRKEPSKDNVPFLLGSLVRPIGRSEPGKCQEDQTAAIKRHCSALSPGGLIRVLVVWGSQARTFPLGAVHSLWWGHMSTEQLITERKPWYSNVHFCLLYCRLVRWMVLESLEATSRTDDL